MPSVFRAYGQLRRGAGPWRSPFLIPTPLLSDFDVESYVSIDADAATPDLRVSLRAISVDQYPTLHVQFIAEPVGPPQGDFTLRMVLLMEAEELFVDSGSLEAESAFAVLQYRVPPGDTFPPQLTIDLLTAPGGGRIDPADSALVPAPIAPPFPVGSFPVDVMEITVRGDPLELDGGTVSGPMVRLQGVRTTYNMFLNNGYAEALQQIRGIDLDWLDPALFPGAPLAPSATWLHATATGFGPGQDQISVRIHTLAAGDAPEVAPVVSSRAGGGLRAGSYRYCTTWVHHNGNESSAGPRSAPVEAGGGNRTVRVEGFPAPPPDPVPDPRGQRVVKRRIYRTDCDTSVSPADVERGDRGDDVLVAETAPNVASVDDTGPANPALPPVLRTGFLEIRYTSPASMDIDGSIRMISGGSDETFSGSLTSAPRTVRVTHQPGREPTLRWLADATTPELTVQMPGFGSPFGTGLFAEAEGVPKKFGLDWSVLGSEYFGIAAAGDKTVAMPVGADPAEPIGRVGVRLGAQAPPTEWPRGDADVVVEISDELTGVPGALIALGGLRRGSVTSGAKAFAERDAAEGRLEVLARFAAATGRGSEFADRTIRVARRSGGLDPLPDLAADAHFVPDEVHAVARFPSAGSAEIELGSRVRFLRARFRALLDDTMVEGDVFLDDTTSKLFAELGSRVEVTTSWPVRAGGTIGVRDVGSDAAHLVLWPDLVVPDSLVAETAWPITAALSEPGVSGRVAVAFDGAPPLAVRSNPQVKALTHGEAEADPGLRSLTARVLGLREAVVPETVTEVGDEAGGQIDVAPIVALDSARPNQSFRAELLEREGRVQYPVDLRAPEGARSWLRARTADLPDRLSPLVRLAGGSPVGGELVASQRWGEGVVWAEPSFVWEESTDELGTDRGIGLITAGWDGIPARVEVWLLDKGAALDGRVPTVDRLPDVGSVGADWVAGGAVVRLDDALRLSHVQLALPGGASRVCWNDPASGGFGIGVILEPDHPVRHGNWTEVIAPFVKLEPTSGGLKEMVLWSASEPSAPPGPPGPEPNPCTSSGSSPSLDTAMGWRITSELRVTMAVRLYDLETPSGLLVPAPRWWSMPTRDEKWNGEDVEAGEWQLAQEVQMDAYGDATVVLYPAETTDNPFGDWQGGAGKWWLRQRGGLDVPLIPLFWWSVSSGDVYMGNVGGGYHIVGTNGIHSSLPKLFNWSYP